MSVQVYVHYLSKNYEQKGALMFRSDKHQKLREEKKKSGEMKQNVNQRAESLENTLKENRQLLLSNIKAKAQLKNLEICEQYSKILTSLQYGKLTGLNNALGRSEKDNNLITKEDLQMIEKYIVQFVESKPFLSEIENNNGFLGFTLSHPGQHWQIDRTNKKGVQQAIYYDSIISFKNEIEKTIDIVQNRNQNFFVLKNDLNQLKAITGKLKAFINRNQSILENGVYKNLSNQERNEIHELIDTYNDIIRAYAGNTTLWGRIAEEYYYIVLNVIIKYWNKNPAMDLQQVLKNMIKDVSKLSLGKAKASNFIQFQMSLSGTDEEIENFVRKELKVQKNRKIEYKDGILTIESGESEKTADLHAVIDDSNLGISVKNLKNPNTSKGFHIVSETNLVHILNLFNTSFQNHVLNSMSNLHKTLPKRKGSDGDIVKNPSHNMSDIKNLIRLGGLARGLVGVRDKGSVDKENAVAQLIIINNQSKKEVMVLSTETLAQKIINMGIKNASQYIMMSGFPTDKYANNFLGDPKIINPTDAIQRTLRAIAWAKQQTLEFSLKPAGLNIK